jgi:Rod binding domain-containing protein
MTPHLPGTLPTFSPEISLPARPPGRGGQAARQFEAQLIASLLESLEKTFAQLPGPDVMAGTDDYNYLGTQAFSESIAARGGFGIAAMIVEHLPGHEGEE